MNERLAIIGSGAIACGLATVAARHDEVQLLARSERSAGRARATIAKLCARAGVGAGTELDPATVEVITDVDALGPATFVVEAVVEDHAVKAALLADLARRSPAETVLATTTSSLSIEQLGQDSGRPEQFLGLHVFNPVTKMKLVELVFPRAASAETRRRASALCEMFEKTAVEVPDVPGFVVNRLLFPYLFSAVRLLQETGMEPADVDTCMRLGAGHPLGPLALLDLVGLDVSRAIGDTLGEPVPARIDELIAAGALGRKSGRGFHSY
ncbi:MAG TPA: 3-hydroxyacyl-CoA dehydrogenase family protein [Solirubrobacteraceae bacterium]|nr:3-hydroxyacyl-CoA dehydrogenase family protein [Solirubrobacteraceae bacterium]